MSPPFVSPNFFFQIDAAVHALRRDGRVKLKGSPPDIKLNIRTHSHGFFKPPLADITPGAHDIRNDVDLKGLYWIIHSCILWSAMIIAHRPKGQIQISIWVYLALNPGKRS